MSVGERNQHGFFCGRTSTASLFGVKQISWYLEDIPCSYDDFLTYQHRSWQNAHQWIQQRHRENAFWCFCYIRPFMYVNNKVSYPKVSNILQENQNMFFPKKEQKYFWIMRQEMCKSHPSFSFREFNKAALYCGTPIYFGSIWKDSTSWAVSAVFYCTLSG